MTDTSDAGISRRDVLKASGKIAAAGALAGVSIPSVYAGENNTVNLALVGCGGRGTGAADNALSTSSGPTKLVAMADVFDNRLSLSHQQLTSRHEKTVQVGDDRKFIGFDAYKHAIDCLNPGDVVILTTPPAFRGVQFRYAIDKGVNVFMEKPVTVDGPSTRTMLDLGEESVQKGLKVGVGLMCRHCVARGELFERIQDGQIGDVLMLRAYRMVGPTGFAFSDPNPGQLSDLMYQIQRFHSFLWASGGAYSDFLIHNIDECCWMKDAWPVEAKASGGRHYRGDSIDQNFDTYSVEYTFADGTKLFLNGRNMVGCHQEFASYVHGSKASAVISASAHSPARCRIYKGQEMTKDNVVWSYPQPEPNPYQLEWDNLINSIRQDLPHNEVKRGAEASLVTAMGRAAAHTGRVVTYDDMLNHEQELGPNLAELTFDSEAPLQKLPNGKYPVPQPGLITKREF